MSIASNFFLTELFRRIFALISSTLEIFEERSPISDEKSGRTGTFNKGKGSKFNEEFADIHLLMVDILPSSVLVSVPRLFAASLNSSNKRVYSLRSNRSIRNFLRAVSVAVKNAREEFVD